MTPENFVIKFYSHAKASSEKSGISPIALLAQAALESGWGDNAPGNMLFGIKASTKLPEEKRQLVVTTEYLPTIDVKFPEIISIKYIPAKGMYKYTVKDWFRKYDSPEESFTDHSKFFLENKRYAEALKVKHDHNAFIDAIAAAGYASDPDYAKILKQVAYSVEKRVKKLMLT